MKKLLCLILAIAMVLGTMGTVAFAAEGEADVWNGTYPEDINENGWIDISVVDDGKEDDLYIYTAEEFAAFAQIVNAWEKTTNPFTNKTVYLNVDIDLDNHEWIPIGPAQPREKNRFYGSFYGQGHTISNLNVAEGYYYAGLFGKVPTWGYTQVFDGITIDNATVASADNTTNDKEGAGALLGGSTGAVVSDCHVTGAIEISGDKFVGGLIGDSYAQISDCSVKATGTITATGEAAGGLVGQQITTAGQAASVTNCAVIGNSENELNVTSNLSKVGGAIGNVALENVTETTISGITVMNVSVEAETADEENGVAYVASGYVAENSVVANVSATLADVEVTPEDNESVSAAVAELNGKGYATLQEAIAAAEVGATITLLADIHYDNYAYASGKTTSVNIPAGKEFTLDLNGYTISGENSSPKSFELITICNGAIVTIDDTSAAQTGKITYEATREEPDGWIDRAHTIFNQGTLILNGGTIENATPESQEAVSSAVDNNCSWGKLGSFTMNGGVVTSAGYYAVRTDVNTHNTTANGTLKAVTNFNGGTVYGFYLMDRGSDLPKMPVNDIEFAVGDDAVVEPANFSNAAAIRIRYGATSKVAVEISEEAEINGAVTGAAAKVGGAYYKTLDEAIADAVAGDTIDLLGNVIEINESKDNMDRDKNLTFENGTLDLTYAGSSDSMFTLYGSETLTFNNVDFVKRDIGLDAKFMCYFINISSANAVVKFNNCDFDFDGSYCTAYDGEWPGHGLWSSVIANNAGGKIYLTDCNIEHEYGNFIYQGGATITNCTYNGYADLDEGDTAGNFLNHNTFPTVISNSNINTRIFGLRNANNKVEIKDNTYIYASLFRISTPLADGETAPVYLDATSKIEAVEMDLTIINEDSEGEIVSEASSVYVQYKKIDSEEGTDKYEIVLVGANNVAGKELINELASADLTFDFEGTLLNGAAMDYAVEAADGVSVTKLGDRYLFNYNGVDKYEESGTAIVIGTITIEGYGSYTLKTDEQAKNAVYATEIRDNIVDGYEDAATLVINADMAEDDGMVGMIDPAATIAVPVRDLAIDIAFKNAVENQSKAYQDMKVVISGGDLAENIEIELGSDAQEVLDLAGKADAAVEVAYANNAYTVAVTDALTYNRAYTVTVSGAGYRTARYTVTMTDDKELRFWNNVMDNNTAVEEGEFETTKTFLAGDIVKDNNINIYDLSAVVSYFGTDGINTQDVSDYAKYDLNRDGVIDSKDVAYVLVSWGE